MAVSDPTQTNTGSISLDAGPLRLGSSFADTNITVTRLAPTIHMSVNVNGSKGLSSTVKFRLVTEQ